MSVTVGKYIGFFVYHRSCILWPSVIRAACDPENFTLRSLSENMDVKRPIVLYSCFPVLGQFQLQQQPLVYRLVQAYHPKTFVKSPTFTRWFRGIDLELWHLPGMFY